jgi:organic radical activating enzyme
MNYPLAPNGVFKTIQGEGVLMGEPMVFVRFAGCSVGCPECDTDYSVFERVELDDLVRRVISVADKTRWVWVTGGEPTIHDIPPLLAKLNRYGFRTALATAGVKEVRRGITHEFDGGPAFLSVSPHRIDETWVQRRGDQINIVPGLNGLRLADLEGVDMSGFSYRYVTPFWYGPGERVEKVAECIEWVQTHDGWRLGNQSHKQWSIL